MKLYIIGNGFDIAHGIPSRYSDFYTYLEKKRCDVLEKMEQYYDVDKGSDLWSDFERELEENICYDSLVEIINKNAPNFTSDDFRSTDWHDAAFEIEHKCDVLLDKIQSSFEEWIESLELNSVMKKYEIDRTAHFFTFNYTEVLESVYKIPSENIMHIHNKVGKRLIFGHGKDIKKFNVKKALYGYDNTHLIIDDEMDEFIDFGHEKYAEIAISDIDEIIVIGHSYNEIDYPYFKKISESINHKATWTLYYFSNNDMINAERLKNEIQSCNQKIFIKDVKVRKEI